jgi:hypothetical protein
LVVTFILLTKLGSKHVESPYILISQGITFLYFILFVGIMPITTTLENTLIDINNTYNIKYSQETRTPNIIHRDKKNLNSVRKYSTSSFSKNNEENLVEAKHVEENESYSTYAVYLKK